MNDEQLVQQFQDGRAEAFDELLHRYQSKVLSTCFRYLTDKEKARDAAHYYLAIAIVLLLGAPLVAQHMLKVDTANDGRKKIILIEKRGDMACDPLYLTDAQKKEFRKLDLQLKKETVSLRNELEIKQLEKQVELDADSPDVKKLNTLIDEIHNLQANVEKKQLAIELKKRDLLTEEQRKSRHPLMGGMERNIFMLKGDAPHGLMWMDDGDVDSPGEREIEEQIEIH